LEQRRWMTLRASSDRELGFTADGTGGRIGWQIGKDGGWMRFSSLAERQRFAVFLSFYVLGGKGGGAT